MAVYCLGSIGGASAQRRGAFEGGRTEEGGDGAGKAKTSGERARTQWKGGNALSKGVSQVYLHLTIWEVISDM